MMARPFLQNNFSILCSAIGLTLQLVGLAHYIFHRSTIQILPTCYMQDLFTSVAARGRGVGRALTESVYERARSANCGRVYWQTHETNLEVMRLYGKRSGALRVHRVP
jgi:GNAT superfamily N-acetyltransferase